jgi:hypothetical protein
MDEKEFLTNVDAISKVVGRIYSRKRLADTAGIDRFKVIMLGISFLLSIIFLLMIYAAIHYDSTSLEVTAYAIVSSAFLIMLSLSLFECLRSSDNNFLSFNTLVKKELNIFLAKINPTFEPRGLEWFVIDGHYWIELRINRE